MSSPYKNLVNNSILFTLANLGSKIITFLMVPLYTFVLTPDLYGTIDIVTTTIGLTTPVIFLCISDAVMRYTMNSQYSKKDILSNGLKVFILGFTLICILCFFFENLFFENKYKIYFLVMFATNGLLLIFNQFLRSIGKIKEFAINGTLYTFILVCSNIILLVKMNAGIYGYFTSIILSNGVCLIYAILSSRAWKYITLNPSNVVLNKMLKYSLPLIPNSLMWWIMDASDKFIITFFLGINSNGIYAISKKIPTIIDTFHSIFNQAWQISAIQENGSTENVNFTSNIYKVYTVLIFSVVSILLVCSRVVVKYVLSTNYHESWKYIPLLLFSVAFSSLSGFLSANFIANEKTGIIFKTTLYGAIINTIMNFILIPLLGINGAALATAISFFVVLKIREDRLINERKLIISFNRKILYIVLACQFIIYYIFPILIATVTSFCFFVFLLFYFRKLFSILISNFFRGFNHGTK